MLSSYIAFITKIHFRCHIRFRKEKISQPQVTVVVEVKVKVCISMFMFCD